MKKIILNITILSLVLFGPGILLRAAETIQFAGNPLFRGADPHAVRIADRVWIYPTHYRGREPGFYAYSSKDLMTWDVHGPILSFSNVGWIDDDGAPRHFAWAPCVAEKDGKYYLYYSVGPQNPTPSRIGVAVSDSPSGPFEDSGRPLLTGGDGFEAIDPMVFHDSLFDVYYLYAGGSAGATLRMFELADNMIEFRKEIEVDTPPFFTEGAFMHFYEGMYYFSYSHGSYRDASYSVHYAISNCAAGPWTYMGPILVSDEKHKGPGHHSFFSNPQNGQWYIAYHRWNNQAGDGPYRGSRQVAIEKIEYDEDGRIKPVQMTDAGVTVAGGFSDPAPFASIPGTVIDHVPQSTGLYVGSPSLAVLESGAYLASHDFFGPSSAEWESAKTSIFRSRDRGKTWEEVAQIDGAFWSNLFAHRGAVYLMGTDRHHGRIVIRRSTDEGETWSNPEGAETGRLTETGEYHTAPMPVVQHDGRLWRAFEDAMGGTAWGQRYQAMMMSVPAEADLLQRENWTFSKPLPRNEEWLNGTFNGWLEGNAVIGRDGSILNILRVDTPGCPEKAAIVKVSSDGTMSSFNPSTGFIDFPGGAKKFTIRYDPESDFYWSLATLVPGRHQAQGKPGGIRNTLGLVRSRDLRTWEIRCILLYHPDVRNHGFQYPDWLIDGNDIIATVRTAYDDGIGGAHNNHDANFLTFHRFHNFRELDMDDSVTMPVPPQTRLETSSLIIRGENWEPGIMQSGARAYSNRDYIWEGIPTQFEGWNFSMKGGGESARIVVLAKKASTVYFTTSAAQQFPGASAWTIVPDSEFSYSDQNHTEMRGYSIELAAGEELEIPQAGWTGGMLIWRE
jgi:hypothetical protein